MSSEEMENIVKEYGDDVYRFCVHLAGNREEAEDLYQDTFIKAIQLCHKLDRSGNVKSYLMGVAVNLWRNNLRKNKRRSEIIPETSFENSQWLISDRADPLEDYMERELKKSLNEAVNHLSERQRVVVLLHYTQNYSAKEISEILHIPRGTVLSRLAKARENIKKELEGNGYEV
ncbi:MAG: RNA polymerase sigma factor [Eubacterium sp.]|nr:RNA polymerase sigma factor [Eubacterium sp.]